MIDLRPRLAVLLSFSGAGGVERMVLNLVDEFARRGLVVDLLAVRAASDSARRALSALPPAVRVVDLGVAHSSLATLPLARYLRRERPTALLAAKDRAIRAAARARVLSGRDPRLVGRLGTTLSAALADRPALQRWWRLRPLRRGYARVDHLVAVSRGVAEDIVATTGYDPARISVVANPVITADLARRAAAPPPHPWLAGPDGPPVVVGAGRLTRQKDFPTLLRAFARLRREVPARLLIVGEGAERDALETLAGRLGVAAQVALPGYSDNLWAYLARARLFVLSSAWEGSPNVLTEALALGVPAVATDCPSGPRELLRGGTLGALVPVGDDAALAAAMRATLDAPLPPETLRAAVADYTAARSATRYLQVLGIDL